MALCRTCRRLIPCHCHATPPVEIAPGIYLEKGTPMTEPQLCGITRDFRGTEQPPCTRPAHHVEAYCHSGDDQYFLADPDDEPARTPMTEPLTTQQLDEIRAVTDAATPGPWLVETHAPTLARLVVSEDRTLVIDFGYVGNRTQKDAAFVAAARTVVPALLADNQHLRQQLENARAEAIAEYRAQFTMTEARGIARSHRAAVLRDAEKEIAAAIDRNRAEHPDSEPMIARRLGMRAAERVVRGMREDAEETHVVADSSNDPEHIDDCPGCEPAAARPAATTQDGDTGR